MTQIEKSLYRWAFAAGRKLLEEYEKMYGTERAEKKMETLLLTLKSESIPDRFRRALIDALIEASPNVGIPLEVKVERPWKVSEFYRYSTAILAGFFDTLNAWREERKKAQGESDA